MKILIPVAAFCEYNTAVYVERALEDMGHEARVITQAEFYEDHDADLFFGVDSAGPLDFPDKHLGRTAMWFIDSRHNCNPDRRQPDDDANARRIHDGGGWVFQAQKKDWLRNVRTDVLRSNWLPLAADPRVWKETAGADKVYDVGFGGNVWDGVRREALARIESKWRLGHCLGTPDQLAMGYSQSRVGFNVSSFYGSEVAYDVNMRVFEVMSCGIPLVTNHLPEFQELGILPEHHLLTYRDLDGAMSQIRLAISRGEEYRREMGQRAREIILEGHTYRHRMEEALEILEEVL